MHSFKLMRGRLSALYFLQFAVWGCYLTCLGQFLGRVGLGRDISWFYSAAGLVSLFMPALAGYLADRRFDSSRLLASFHFIAACFMFSAWSYVRSAQSVEFMPLFILYVMFLCFFMPTIPLANTLTFSILGSRGMNAAEAFPGIRFFGTVGFIAAMWFVNCAYLHDGTFGMTLSDANPMARWRFQYTDMMLFSSGIIGIITSLYVLTFSVTGNQSRGKRYVAPEDSFVSRWLGGFMLLKNRNLRIFLIFAILGGVCLQITNGFATPFITHFSSQPEYAGSGAAANATMLFSLSQISEAACILLIPFFLRRYGFRVVLTISFLAWALRFALFGWGNPGDGLWMLVASMLVYGVAFDFFNIAGAIYMEQNAGAGYRGRAQGILMMMSNGIGTTFGMIWAGAVVNAFCNWRQIDGMRYFIGDWSAVWMIFAAYALALAVAFPLLFRRN